MYEDIFVTDIRVGREFAMFIHNGKTDFYTEKSIACPLYFFEHGAYFGESMGRAAYS